MTVTIWIDDEPHEAESLIREDGTLIVETENIRIIEPPRLQQED